MKDDDDEWMAFQNETKKDNMLETKSKETHLVHSPYFPLVSSDLPLKLINWIRCETRIIFLIYFTKWFAKCYLS